MESHEFVPCPTPLLVGEWHRLRMCHQPRCIAGPERHGVSATSAMVDGTPYTVCRTCSHAWPTGNEPEHGLRCPSGPQDDDEDDQ